MERRTGSPRFLIYDRKEVAILSLLGVLVAAFAFTLGIHLGKRSRPVPDPGAVTAEHSGGHGADAQGHGAENHAPIPTAPDSVPNRQELAEMERQANQAAAPAIDQSLHEEVNRAGLKLEVPRQLELPREPVSRNAGATTPAKPEEEVADEKPLPPVAGNVGRVPPARSAPARAGGFALQIGSFPSSREATARVSELARHGLRAELREAKVEGKEWYRVVLGAFPSKQEADATGKQYVAKGWIEAYLVAPRAPASPKGE